MDPQVEHRLAQQAAGVAAEDQMTVALQRQRTLADRRGRGWGRQVIDIARDLETFLNSRGATVTANLGSFKNSSITVVSIGTDYLLDHLRNEPTALDANIRSKVAQLIRRDHAFHAERRAPRRRSQ